MSYETERGEMVDGLIRRGVLSEPSVTKAMRKVPRHLFVPKELEDEAYIDSPLSIGEGQTISAPHMVAIMTQALEVRPKSRILEIGAGSGYQAAVLAELAKEIYTVERIPELAKCAEENLKNAGYEKMRVIVSDGTLGYPEKAPYDRIIVTAAAPKIPKALIDQLDDGGILLVPVGSRWLQNLIKAEKSRGKIKETNLGGCVFVPLVGEDGWD